MRHRSFRPQPSRPATATRPIAKPWLRLAKALCLVAVLAVSVPVFWNWRWSARPGEVCYRRGLSFMAAGQPAQARQQWLQGVQDDPTFAPCYVRLGEYYLSVQRPREASLSYSAAAQLQPNDEAIWRNLAEARRQQNDLPGASQAALRATQVRPKDAEALTVYADLAEQQNDIPSALAALRRAHELGPDARSPVIAMARIEVTEHMDLDQAGHDLAVYLQAHPRDAEACYLMAGYYEEQPHTSADLQKALLYAQRARAGAPNNPNACVLQGEIELGLQHPAEALSAYQAGLQLSPQSDRALQGLVRCYGLLDEPQQAARIATTLAKVNIRHTRMEHLKDMIRLNPANTRARREMANLEEQDGDIPRARAEFEALLRQPPHDPRDRTALSSFYRRTGNHDLAQQALNPSFIP